MMGLFEAMASAWGLLTLLVWGSVALFAPARFPAHLSPEARALRARLWLYAPLWLPVMLVGASILPGLLGGLLGWQDHCVTHGGHHHHHLCVLHPPHLSSHQPLVLGALTALGALVVLGFGRTVWSGIQQCRLVRALVMVSRPSLLGEDVRVLEQDAPIALTTGLFEPVILLSQGLIEHISPDTLRVVLAHERAHITRRDTAWALLDTMMATLLPRARSAALLDALLLAREQACDLSAATVEGRVRVAQALMDVARFKLREPVFGMSMGASSLEARVLYLLQAPAPSRREVVVPIAAVLALLACGVGPVHTLIEQVITRLLH